MNLCSTPVRILLLFLIQSSITYVAASGAERLPPSKLQGSGVAQTEQARNEEDFLTVPEVTVTAIREPRRVFNVSQDVTVLEKSELERRSPTILPDLLRGPEGVYVQQTTPGQATPIIRGLIGSSVLTLVDGMRLNNAFFRPSPTQYLALVDPNIVDRLEIVRGPGSTLYGSDALGGVLNILTHVPRFEWDAWRTNGKVLAQFGSADISGGGRMMVEGGKRGIGFSGGITYRNIGDLRGGGAIGTQEPSDYSSYAADGTVFVERDRQDFFLNAQYLRQPKTPRYDEVTTGFGQTQPSSSRFFFEPNDRLFVHGRYRLYHPVSFVDRIEVHASYQQVNDDRRAMDFGSTIEQRERNRSDLIGFTTQMTTEWPRSMTLTYGTEAYFDTVRSSRLGTDSLTGTINRLQSRFASGSSMNTWAVYVQGEWHLHPRLTAIAGGRISYFDVDIPQADRQVGTAFHVVTPTGNLGLIFHLTETVNLVSNIGRGFRVPNVFDLSTLGDRPGNRFNLPNPSLGPEQIYSGDVGVKVASSRLTGEAFVFYSFIPDKIETQPTGGTTTSGQQIVQNENTNQVTIVGIEAGGRYRVMDQWDLVAGMTLTHGEEEFADGRKAPASLIPPINGLFGSLYRFSPNLWVESFVRVALRQDRLSERDSSDPRINPDGTPGWITVTIRGGWQINPVFQIRVALENLFNQPYREHGSGISAPGRNFVLAVQARF
jgi:hemoglobin/transferrin/lactoferrin receptor protein